jgi:hypothetical protein|tara:strand:+ start:1500 stop:2762 length:1263 start_codon:yes stop_codon:yes gene_type:complete
MVKTIDSKELIRHTRFDLIIKYLYANSMIKNYDTDFFRKIYKEHLRLWNGFKEYNNPDKNSFEKFDQYFKDIIESIKTNGFDSNISTVPTQDDFFILNGAHRTAACIALEKEIQTTSGTNGKDGMYNCGWDFFKGLGYPTKYADKIAIEYSKLKNNTHMVLLFPAAKGQHQEALNILNNIGKVFYYKSTTIENNGPLNLMRELYVGEAWAGNHQTNYSGFRDKARLCYTNNNPTISLLVEFDNLDDTIKAKKEIRNLYGVGNHSVHINDTHEETVRIAKLMFNDNSIHHLNNSKIVKYDKFDLCIENFKNYITNNGYDLDDYCIGGSSTLSSYGLREGNDLDYLHFNVNEIKDNLDLIHSHNEYGKDRYPYKRDEIIFNPEHHYYSKGVKFASLDVIKKLKEKRNEPKDTIDIDLINSIL